MRNPRAFTDRFLASLKPAAKRYDMLDPARRGLMLRVTACGTKTFFFRYQRRGRTDRLMLGRYPATSLREAYELHAELTKRLNRGEELRSLAPMRRDALFTTLTGEGTDHGSAATTVGELAKEFLRRYIYRERKHPEEAEKAITGNILKYWKHRPAKTITRRDGVLLLDRIVDRGSPVMANRVGALLAQMFTFGVERGMLDASPFISMPRPGGSEKPRHRKLDEREVRIFWKKITRARLSFEVRTALKLILVTAQRPGEVALAAREEFDLDRGVWTIPAERSKNGKAHEVPLSALALALLRHLRRRFGESSYLLPSRCWRERQGAPITVRSLSQGLRDNEQHFRIPHFTPHDLRRTAASLMTAAGIPRLHVEKVLNHTIDDVAEIYDRHDYAEEKRIAVDRLGDSVTRILRGRGTKVVQLRTRELLRLAS